MQSYALKMLNNIFLCFILKKDKSGSSCFFKTTGFCSRKIMMISEDKS